MTRAYLAVVAACLVIAATTTSARAQASPAPGATYAPVGASPAQPKVAAPTATYAPPAPGHGFQTFAERREMFVVGDYLIHPRVHNEFSPGNGGKGSYRLRGGTEFNLGNFQGLIEGEFRSYTYRHEASVPAAGRVCPAANEPGCVTAIGRRGQTFVRAFDAQDEQVDGRLGLKLLEPRLYLGIGYLTKSNNAGYPNTSGLGIGIEKLPDKEGPLSVYFSTYYYPNLTGAYHAPGPSPGSLGLTYRLFKYEVGAALKPSGSPVFLNVGLLGDRTTARNASPSNETRIAPYAGIGFFTH